MHEGHRKRMLERLAQDGDGLQDHELLEILLYYSLPRINTNPLGHALIAAFGTAGNVLSAPMEQLLAVEGIGPSTAALICTVGQLHRRADAATPKERPCLRNPAAFTSYLLERLGGMDREVVEVHCLDNADRVNFSKRFTSFRPDRADFQGEELAGLLAAHRPKGIVVGHNHPGLPAVPSHGDDIFTAQVQILCSLHGVALYDHIIVGKERTTYSYFLSGTLDKLRHINFNSLIGGLSL